MGPQSGTLLSKSFGKSFCKPLLYDSMQNHDLPNYLYIKSFILNISFIKIEYFPVLALREVWESETAKNQYQEVWDS